jgi:hypothetical protein
VRTRGGRGGQKRKQPSEPTTEETQNDDEDSTKKTREDTLIANAHEVTFGILATFQNMTSNVSNKQQLSLTAPVTPPQLTKQQLENHTKADAILAKQCAGSGLTVAVMCVLTPSRMLPIWCPSLEGHKPDR